MFYWRYARNSHNLFKTQVNQFYMIKIIKVKNYTTNAINLSRLSFKYKIIQIREKKNNDIIIIVESLFSLNSYKLMQSISKNISVL